MKLFSKIALICNVSFLVFVLLAYVELNNKAIKGSDNIMPLPFLTGTIVILGQFAIFINFIFCLVVMILLLSKKIINIPRWVLIFNSFFLLLQVFYFFIF